MRSITTSGWDQVTDSEYELKTNGKVDRKSAFRIFNIKDIATKKEAETSSCDCIIHSTSRFMHKDEGVSLNYKFGGSFDGEK